jgi:hypothetical protein
MQAATPLTEVDRRAGWDEDMSLPLAKGSGIVKYAGEVSAAVMMYPRMWDDR